jgi:hypothetical protein
MKRIVLFVFIALFSTHSFAQKKKSNLKKSIATAGLAKVDNLVAEIKAGNFQISITEAGKPSDALIIKSAEATFAPLDCKIVPFTAAGTKLYLVTWTEKSTTKTDLKTEDVVSNYVSILDIPNKKIVFSNTETTSHIIEKVFLDKGKNASETQEKLRREGAHFVLNPDGSILLKNKTSEKTFLYDTVKIEYLLKKK